MTPLALTGVALIACLCAFVELAGATTSTPAEKWVIAQARAGKLANLERKFPVVSDRVLRASFLEDLLTDSIPGVTVHRRGVRIAHAIVSGPLDLTNAEVIHETWLDDCEFPDAVDLGHAHFHKLLSLTGSRFKGDVNFNGAKIDNAFFIRNARFAGPVDFRLAQIAATVEADRSQFADVTEGVTFNSMKIGYTAFFRDARFAGPVDFQHAQFALNLEGARAQFTDLKEGANFRAMRVGQFALFHGAKFAGPVDFGKAQIGANFEAHEAEFTNAEKEARFNFIKVDGAAIFHNAKFAGLADFRNAHIASNFEASQTHFGGRTYFDSIRIDGRALFYDPLFDEAVYMADAKLLDLVLAAGQKRVPIKLKRFDLARTEIARELMVRDVEVAHLIAVSLRVSGPTVLSTLSVTARAELDLSSFSTISMSNVSWPSNAALHLGGMTFQKAMIDGDSSRVLHELIERAAYSADAYANLEQSLRRQGQVTQGDDVYVAMKRRERREVLKGIPRVRSLALDCLVRYGRSPEWAFGWSALFVAFGTWLFWGRENMQPRDPESSPTKYNAFWYSTALFLPVVRMSDTDDWMPREGRRFASVWVRVHIVAGWVLIPLGLAALTGVLK